MAQLERVLWLTDFAGIKETLNPTFSKNDNRFTRDLSNIKVRYGQIVGRKGIDELEGITGTSSAVIIGLPIFSSGIDSASILFRMLPTAIEELDPTGNTWTDRTGTALTGGITTRPAWTMHKGVLTFTNEGNDRPRRITATGTNSVVLGGTPPFAMAIESFLNFLFLGNISDNGTLFFPRKIRYSDDYNVNWDLCDGNEINVNECQGEILALKTIGRSLMVYCTDGFVQLRFLGNAVRFEHNRLPFRNGLLAPLSVGAIDKDNHIALATDAELYLVNESKVTALPPAMIDTLQKSMDIANARQCVGIVDHAREIYNLFYPTAAADTWLRGRMQYNYRTREFNNNVYDGHQFTRAAYMRYDDTLAYFMVASASDDLVYLMDTNKDDNGTAVDRFFKTDWQNMGFLGDKFLTGITIIGKKASQARIGISVARNYSEEFKFKRDFSLKGMNPAAVDAWIRYKFPYPIQGNAFNVKLDMYHDGDTNVAEVKAIGLQYIPLSDAPQEPSLNEFADIGGPS